MSSRIDKKEHQYTVFWEKLGIRIRKMLMLFFLLTIAVQSIIAFNIDLLPRSTTMELEGKAVIESYHYESRGQVRIACENHENMDILKIYINGEQEEIGSNNSVVLNVRNNDVIEIDGVGINKKVNVIVEEISGNVILPKAGMKYKIDGNIVALGRVKLK